MVNRLEGVCPTCGGRAFVYPFSEGAERGHVYCREDECGWIHRGLMSVNRHVDSEVSV